MTVYDVFEVLDITRDSKFIKNIRILAREGTLVLRFDTKDQKLKEIAANLKKNARISITAKFRGFEAVASIFVGQDPIYYADFAEVRSLEPVKTPPEDKK